MEKKALLKKLIAHYTKAGREMAKENWRGLQNKKEIQVGICHCAYWKFQVDIFDQKWVGYWCGLGKYWILPLANCASISQAVANIETRIEIMCHELYSGV